MFKFANMLVLKLTRGCNLNCSYCYVRNKEKYKDEMIDYDLYKKIVDRIVKDKVTNPSEQAFSLILHGGEPLLASKNQLSKMFHYASKTFERNNITYKLGIQTNLTLLDEEFALILNQYDVHLGASFDGIKEANTGRTKAFGQKVFEEKFKLIEKYSIKYGFLMVAGQHNIKRIKETTDYILKRYNITGIKINYAEDVNNLGGEVSGEDFFKYAWKPYIDEYIKTGKCTEDNTAHTIDLFMIYAMARILQANRQNCGTKFCGGGINIVEIEPTGKTFLCGRYSEEYPQAYMMHALEPDFLSLKQLKKYLNFVYEKHELVLQAHCDSCYADYICDHGCMAFHLSKYGKYGIRKDLVCPMFKNLYKYLVINEYAIVKSFFNTNKNESGTAYLNGSAELLEARTDSALLMKLSQVDNIVVDVSNEDAHTLILQKNK